MAKRTLVSGLFPLSRSKCIDYDLPREEVLPRPAFSLYAVRVTCMPENFTDNRDR